MRTQNTDTNTRDKLGSLMLPTQRLSWIATTVLICGFVALDWASYIHPLRGLNITPWNPAPALGLLFLLRFGKKVVLPLALAILAADVWVRNLPLPFFTTLSLAALLSVGYWAIAEALRYRLSSRSIFHDQRGLLNWSAILILGTLTNSFTYVETLVLSGILPINEAQEAFIRYWIGDCVGALVSMPIMWMLLEEQERTLLKASVIRWETLGYIGAIGLSLWIAFGIGASADFKYFYALFLPVVWAATRQGLSGAVVSAGIMQVGIIGTVQFLEISVVTLQELQALSAALALFGFFVGIVMDEKQRISTDLRQSLRLAAAGEMAGALAHELNQPLTALSVYGTACNHLLEQGVTGDPLRKAIKEMIAESARAAEVVRRLRDFFRTGATQLELLSLDELFEASTAAFRRKARDNAIELTITPPPPCRLLADRMQLEVVLRNLLSNAFDAVSDAPAGNRQIQLFAQLTAGDRVMICIEDSGQGLSGTAATRAFEAFQSTKTSGLGLGLAISRAIVDAHGGYLVAEVADHGAFKIELPIEDRGKNAK